MMQRLKRKLVFALVAIAVLALLVAVLRVWPKPTLREQIPSSTAIYDAKGKLMRLTLAADEQYRLWVPLDDISPELQRAVLLHEDQYFYRHPGVNPAALVRAAYETYSGGAKQGASTLTMQLARLMYGLNTRSATGKLQQIALALWLEARYSKRDIIEAYLNRVPYGQNIEGAAAASLIYFGKRPAKLTLQEALTLAVIPQSPTRRALAREQQSSLAAARARLFARWIELNPQHADQAGMIAQPLAMRGSDRLPFVAPHVTTQLLLSQRDNKLQSEIHSTIDFGMQRLLERQIASYMLQTRRVGITNASAMLVDWTSMEVKAVVGSANFFDEAIEGQVNGTLAKRSPGSTLKPFIYALAIDQGVLHPMTVLKDAPTSFGPFSPENFDGQFLGPITAQDALVRSRNVPAVAVNARLTQPSLYSFLRAAGVSRMASERHYGLALALGGGEVTMEELASLYAMLPNQGELKPLQYARTKAAAASKPQQLLSAEASYITLDMLTNNPRPDMAYAGNTARVPIAWKTGTSWGFRDAWTAGVFGRYVLVVWLGNFDGEPNPALVGVQTAAPLFFNIADAVSAHDPSLRAAVRQPANLARIEVCQASGDLPNADCPLKTRTWFIPGKSPIKVSNIHRAVFIDGKTGNAACPPFDPATTRREVFEYWPSDLQRLFAQAGMPRRTPPAPVDCNAATGAQGNGPMITSPLRGVRYELRAKAAEAQSITLAAAADGGVRDLYWFAGSSFIGHSKNGHALTWHSPTPGKHLIRVIDDHGQVDAREVQIELLQ